MIKTFTPILSIFISLCSFAQTQITNGDFENWEGSGSSAEPVSWNSNKTGTGLASSGPQTCFQETTNPHSGNSCVRIESKYFVIAVVNGNVTTGVVNAPSGNKSEGYLGATGANKLIFTGQPDSLVGWYKYTQATGGTGASAEQGKVRVILHSGGYYDPETPVSSNHNDSSANKIADALFLTPQANVSIWTRFSVPFNYGSSTIPSFIMVNITSSNNQNTVAPNSSSTGSKLWVDDLTAIYNAPIGVRESSKADIKVYCYDKTIYFDLTDRTDNVSVLNVLDMTGKQIMSHSIENNKLNIVHLPSTINNGVYLYQITGNGAQSSSGKIVVE